MDALLMREMKQFQTKNARLKKMYAEERLKTKMRQDALEGSCKSIFVLGYSVKAINCYAIAIHCVCICLGVNGISLRY